MEFLIAAVVVVSIVAFRAYRRWYNSPEQVAERNRQRVWRRWVSGEIRPNRGREG